MKIGTVRAVLASKQYGFIASGDKKDFFFHREDFIGHWDDLVEDYENEKEIKVQFEESQTPKGPRASNVSRLDEGI